MNKNEHRTRVSRRRFMAAGSAAALVSTVLPGGDQVHGRANDAKSRREQLANFIHPDVQVVRTELPREENAFWSWMETRGDARPLSEFRQKWAAAEGIREGTERYESLAEDLWGEYRPDNPLPASDAGRCVRAWVKAHASTYERISAGLKGRRFQWPEEQLADFLSDDASANVSHMIGLRSLKRARATVFLADGDHGAFVDELMDLLSMGKLVAEGDGYMIHFVIGAGLQAAAIEKIAAYACFPAATLPALERLRAAVSQSRLTAETLAHAYRIEVCYYICDQLASVPSQKGLAAIVDELIRRHLMFYQEISPAFRVEPERVDRVRRGMLALFDGHPAPWDGADTMRRISHAVAGMIADLQTPWLARNQAPARESLKEIEAWPKPLWYRREDLLDIPLAGDKGEAVPESQIAAARRALLKVRNPIGKLMLHDLGDWDMTRRAWELARLRTDAVLAVIACRRYVEQNGRPPDSLSRLVEAGLLESVPTDPFSGRPLRYSFERQIIWSYGVDETDAAADWDFDARFPEGMDIAWRTPSAE